jgi:hypothetical protein
MTGKATEDEIATLPWSDFNPLLQDLTIKLRRNGWNAACQLSYGKPATQTVQVSLMGGFAQADALELFLTDNGYANMVWLSVERSRYDSVLAPHRATITLNK